MSTLLGSIGSWVTGAAGSVSKFATSGGLADMTKLVGQGLELYGTIYSSQAKSKAMKREGRAELRKAEWEAEQLRKKRRKMLARQKVLYAKAGVDLEGSPLAVMEDTRREFEQDIQFTLKGGREAHKAARRGAAATQRAGYIKAGKTALTAFGNFMTSSPLLKRKKP